MSNSLFSKQKSTKTLKIIVSSKDILIKCRNPLFYLLIQTNYGFQNKVYAEYGNVGTEFNYITTSGFGWMNASYQYGLSLLSKNFITSLNKLEDPNVLFINT